MLQALPEHVLVCFMSLLSSSSVLSLHRTCKWFSSEKLWKKVLQEVVTDLQIDIRNQNHSCIPILFHYLVAQEREWVPIPTYSYEADPSALEEFPDTDPSPQNKYISSPHPTPLLYGRFFAAKEFQNDTNQLLLFSSFGDIIELCFNQYVTSDLMETFYWMMVSKINGTQVYLPLFWLQNGAWQKIDGTVFKKNVCKLMIYFDVKIASENREEETTQIKEFMDEVIQIVSSRCREQSLHIWTCVPELLVVWATIRFQILKQDKDLYWLRKEAHHAFFGCNRQFFYLKFYKQFETKWSDLVNEFGERSQDQNFFLITFAINRSYQIFFTRDLEFYT